MRREMPLRNRAACSPELDLRHPHRMSTPKKAAHERDREVVEKARSPEFEELLRKSAPELLERYDDEAPPPQVEGPLPAPKQ